MNDYRDNQPDRLKNIILLNGNDEGVRNVASAMSKLYGIEARVIQNFSDESLFLKRIKPRVFLLESHQLNESIKKSGHVVYLKNTDHLGSAGSDIIQLRNLISVDSAEINEIEMTQFADDTIEASNENLLSVSELVFDSTCDAFIVDEEIEADFKVA